MLDFFKKLLPNVEKRRVLSQIETVREDIQNIFIPSVAQVNQTLVELGIKATASKRAQNFEKLFNRHAIKYLDRYQQLNYGSQLLAVAEHIVRKLEILEEYVKKNFVENLVTSAITYKQLHVLRLIDLSRFWFEYAMKFIHQSNHEECQAVGVKFTNKPLADAQLTWLEKHFQTFVSLSGVFAEKKIEFEKLITETSDLIISETEDEAKLIGFSSDPHRLGFMPVIGDIILLIRESNLVNDNAAYEANRLRLQTLQLQLEALKSKMNSGNIEPSIYKQIEYQMSRIRDLEYKVREYEIKAGVYDYNQGRV